MESLTKIQIAEQEKVHKEFLESNLPRMDWDILVEEIMLPSWDGVKLRTILYRPVEKTVFPTVVVRTSYPQEDHIYRATAEEYCKAGFAYIYQYCRGVGGYLHADVQAVILILPFTDNLSNGGIPDTFGESQHFRRFGCNGQLPF